MLVDLFIEITRAPVAIMLVVFSAVHCNYAGDCFCCSYVCNFLFLSVSDAHFS